MAESLDGYIARKDGSVYWMDTPDHFADGDTIDPEFGESFLKAIDCYVMGSRTYETGLGFEAKGSRWSYSDKPILEPAEVSHDGTGRVHLIPYSREDLPFVERSDGLLTDVGFTTWFDRKSLPGHAGKTWAPVTTTSAPS